MEECWEDLLDEEREEHAADCGQDEVVDDERGLQFEGIPVLHELSPSKDNDVVAQERGYSALQGGHGRHSRDELEIRRRLAGKSREALAEVWPEMDAKGTVECNRHGQIISEEGIVAIQWIQ